MHYNHVLLLVMLIINGVCCVHAAEKKEVQKKLTAQPLPVLQVVRVDEKRGCWQRIKNAVYEIRGFAGGVFVAGILAKAMYILHDLEQAELTAICDNPSTVNGFTLESTPLSVPMIDTRAGGEWLRYDLCMVNCSRHDKFRRELSGPYLRRQEKQLPLLNEVERNELHKSLSHLQGKPDTILYWKKLKWSKHFWGLS